jgi:hypothetical protein
VEEAAQHLDVASVGLCGSNPAAISLCSALVALARAGTRQGVGRHRKIKEAHGFVAEACQFTRLRSSRRQRRGE